MNECVLGYEKLYDYCGAVYIENIGTKLVLQLNNELNPPALVRMYYSLNGLKNGFLAGCRPLISLEGCFLKGPYRGHLLSAVGRDANDNIYPIAVAYVERKKYDSWYWFINIMLNDIGSQEDKGWVFISDRQKGLVEAVHELAPNGEHKFCLRHMYNNFKSKFRGLDMKKLFSCAASTANADEHNG